MQTITVTKGANLYALAAQYLQDATQWIRIAQQNGITDPFLTDAPANAMGLITLTIPDLDPSATGGVPPQ